MRLVRRVAVFLAAVLVLMAVPSAASATTADEAAFLAKINALRATKGAQELCLNPELEAMAKSWAHQMALKGSISHNPNLGSHAPDGWQKMGENVGVGYSVDSLHQAFVNSPGHYANLVDSAYNQAGVGVVEANGKKYVVEVFMKNPKLPENVTKPAPAPAPKRSTTPPPVKPKMNDELSPKLRSYRSSVAVAK